MGMKPRAKAEPPKAKCKIRLERSDGFTSVMDGLSYEAGLAISVIMNRDGLAETVVSWKEGDSVETVEVPAR